MRAGDDQRACMWSAEGSISKFTDCLPAFDQQPDCHPVTTTLYVSSTETCAQVYVELNNITTPEIVQQITEVNAQLDQVCGSFTTEVRL